MRVSYSISITPSPPFQHAKSGIFNVSMPDFSRFFKMSQAQDNAIRLKTITDKLTLKYPLSVPYKKENGCFTTSYSIEGLIIAVAEETYEEMVADFKYQFSEAWNYYACDADENLSEGAKQVKQWLLRNVTEA